jgi:hypothetical protein
VVVIYFKILFTIYSWVRCVKPPQTYNIALSGPGNELVSSCPKDGHLGRFATESARCIPSSRISNRHPEARSNPLKGDEILNRLRYNNKQLRWPGPVDEQVAGRRDASRLHKPHLHAASQTKSKWRSLQLTLHPN